MFKKISEDAKLPTRATRYSACVDVYANEDVTIGAGETKLVGLGIAIDTKEIDRIVSYFFYYKDKNKLDFKQTRELFLKTHYLQLMLRSSLGKNGLILPNGVGIIDLDYKDEIKMIIHNPIKSSEILNYIILTQELNDETQINTDFEIKKGDRIGQITLLEHKSNLFCIESEEERNGGFGSTGER